MTDEAQFADRGFATRAIRVSSRVPRVDQEPTAVPIYRTATFCVRMSVGLEDLDDLASDLTGGLRAARTAAVV